MDIYFNMTWMEEKLRASVSNTILNSEYDMGEVWCCVEDTRTSYTSRRTSPMDEFPVWKSAKTTCLGKYQIDINSHNQHYHEDISDLWDNERWLQGNNKKLGWKVWNTKPKKSRSRWANRYYGATRYEFRIQAKKELIEPSRAIQEAVSDTMSLQTDLEGVLLEHKWLYAYKDPFVVEVKAFNEFRTVLHQGVWKYQLLPYQINHWEASVQTILSKRGFSNVSFNIKVEELDEKTLYDTQRYILTWKVL